VCINLTKLIGWQADGGYAEKVVVPERNLLILPEDIPELLAPLLLDTIGTAAHGIRLARKVLSSFKSALVFGCGSIGLGSIILLRWLGIEEVFFVEPNRQKASVAEKVGGLPISEEQLSNLPIPLIVEASGSLEARNQALRIVQPGGAVLLLGENDQPWILEERPLLRRKDVFIVRSFYFPRSEYSENIGVLRENLASYELIVDKLVSPEQFPGVFSEFVSGSYIKPVLLW
ncbi:MAG: hypothetical protein RMK51_11825, partial [Meiothermus sp.]|uniref:hypothetical protein n=1 Tax=Meiothermus sp. TaxID=1955249 RepID=UPI0029938BC7|nr:hypothetical protein [Meiothermus sp.]